MFKEKKKKARKHQAKIFLVRSFLKHEEKYFLRQRKVERLCHKQSYLVINVKRSYSKRRKKIQVRNLCHKERKYTMEGISKGKTYIFIYFVNYLTRSRSWLSVMPLCLQSLICLIPWILGPDLYKTGEFHSFLSHSENMVSKVDEVKSMSKFNMKRVLCLAMAVGHMKMTHEQLVYSIVYIRCQLLDVIAQEKLTECLGFVHMGKPQCLQ